MENRKKRTILFIGSLCDGGAERVVSILAGKMADAGKEMEILLYYDTEIAYAVNPKVRVTCIEKETKTRNILVNLMWMRRYLKENAQCLVSFLAVFNMLAIISTVFLNIPVVVADRNDPRCVPSNAVIRWMRNILYRFADGVVVQTKHNQDYFPACIRKKSVIIYNPMDLGQLAGAALTCETRKEIVAVGRLIEQKNHEMLFRAFAQIHAHHPDYCLKIYGEGPLREQDQKQINSLGLDHAVKLPGNVHDIHQRIQGAELFVLCSNHEGMSNALMEAMGLGLPVISTRVSGAEDLMTHGQDGLLIPCGDTQALVNAMEMMLTDPALRERCARNATQINARLAADKICNAWMDYLDSVQ